MKKQLFILIFSLFLFGILAACTSEEKAAPESDEPQKTEAVATKEDDPEKTEKENPASAEENGLLQV